MRNITGLILLDKPTGPTSHDMVDAVRRGANIRRVGHGGTLDPLATGLLVICLGPATRLSEYLTDKDKRYRARVRLGQTSTTYDADGRLTPVGHTIPLRDAVEAALAAFRGPQMQRPPAYSAIKRGGVKAYDMARRGLEVDLEPRPIEIFSLALTDWAPPFFTLDVHCSAGTYIRSLAHDLGQALHCGAHLAGLRRTASGNFRLEDAVALDTLQKAFAARDWQRYVLSADAAVPDWPIVHLTAEGTRDILHGQTVPLGDVPPGSEWGRAYNPAGEFIAIVRAEPEAGVWRPHKVLAA